MSRGFKAEDVKNVASLTKLLEDITKDPSLVDDLPEEELAKLEHLISPYGNVPEASVSGKFSCISYTNLRKQYLEKLITTSMVGYLYRRCDEYGRKFKDTVLHELDDLDAAKKKMVKLQGRLRECEREMIAAIRARDKQKKVYEAELEEHKKREVEARQPKTTKERLAELNKLVAAAGVEKNKLRDLTHAIKVLEDEREAIQGFGKRVIVREFLNEQFQFNADKHVRASYSSSSGSVKGETYISKFVPPKDTYHNFRYYMDSNYEELRGVTEKLYGVKPDLDVGIMVHGSEFASEEAADDFVERNKDSTIADIITVKNGVWNFLESFKANRDRIEAYRGTIVEDILEQVREDTKIGAELTRDRAVRRRVENIKETSPDPKMVREYMAEQGNAAHEVGVEGKRLTNEDQEKIYKKHVEKIEADRTALVEAAEEKEEAAPVDTLRVNVFNFSGGGQNLDKSYFLTKAKKKPDNHEAKRG